MPKETEPSVPGSGKEAARQVVQPDNATVAAGPGAVTNVTPPTDVGGREKNDPASNALPETLRRGKKYEIGKVVARGGMGAILDAKETAIERSVAMKVMLDAESPDALARFVTEGKVTGQLEHPNIVPVHELGVDEQQQVFYTMKFVRGDTLRKVLEQLAAGDADTIRKYPLSHLLTIFQKVCDAMAFAHSKGVIHRDLKPENIMLGDFGEVLVMDWGLAKVLGKWEGPQRPDSHDDAATHAANSRVAEAPPTFRPSDSGYKETMTGTIMGTPQYMPPEQAHGRIEQLDARSDIYSLGAILYHILTLQPSVEGDDVMQVLFKVGNGQIVSPAQAVAAVYDRRSSSLERTAGGHRPPLQHLPGGRVPESLSAVVMKAMALKQEDRYQSVPELQRDIEAYQNGFATSAEHASLLRQLALLVKRHKREFGIGFAALLVLLGFSVWFVINLRVSERKATHNAEIATANEQKAVEEKENTRRALAKSQLALAEAAFREQDGPGMQAALNAVPEDLRDSNWNYLLAQSDTSIATIRSRRGDVWAAVPHPKKPGVFAIIGPEAWVTLVEVRTGARLLEFQADVREKKDLVYPLAISPDGDRLAIGDRSAGRIVMHSARDGRKLAEWETAHPTMLQFSPDGARLLEVVMEPKTGLGKQLNLWDAAAGRVLWEKKFQRPHAVFDPTGETLLVASARKLMILNVKDGALLRELPEVKEDLGHLCIHPDGARALAGRMKGFVRCLDLRDGRVLYEMRCGQQAPSALAYAPDGERFVTLTYFTGDRPSLEVWDADSGVLLQPLLGGRRRGRGLSVHPLSGEIMIYGVDSRVWDLAGQREKWRLRCGNALNLAFWKSDDWIFIKGGGVGMNLLDVQNSDPVQHPLWKSKAGVLHQVSVSADGRFAAVGEIGRRCHIQFLRLNGRSIEEIRAFETERDKGAMALSKTSDRLWLGHSVMDPATGKELISLDRKGLFESSGAGWLNDTQVVEAVTINSRRYTAGSEESLILWDTTTGRRLRTVVHPSPILALAVAPGGRTLAEAGADRMVRLRDAATLQVNQEFRAHDGSIVALAFHPSQPILASASEDLTVKLWNLNTGRCLEELRGPLLPPKAVAFSPSGKRLAALCGDLTTRIWEPPSLNPDAAKAKRLE